MKGKVALITGGVTGLGVAIARRFSNSGASIVVTGRRKDLIKTQVDRKITCNSVRLNLPMKHPQFSKIRR